MPTDPAGPSDLSNASTPGPGHQRWLVSEVMPEHECHLLVGAGGVGKTIFAVQLLTDIQSGALVFGRRSFPTGVVWVSCDRSENGFRRYCDALQVPYDRFQYFGQRDSPLTLSRMVETLARLYPSRRLIFVDGFARLLPRGVNIADYQAIADFLCEASQLCLRWGVTILGCLHSAKSKEGQEYTNPREQALGSTAWGTYCELMLVLQRANPRDPQDPVRILHVLSRGAAGEFTLKFQSDKTAGGLLVPWTDPAESDLLSMLDWWLKPLDVDHEIPTREIISEAAKSSISVRSAERWIAAQLESGRLVRASKGKYRKGLVQ